jgi:hypothetical protein
MSQLHWFEHRPCTPESSIRLGYMISFQVYLLHCCFILSLYFYNNVLHLTSIWLEYHSLFQDLCFTIKFGGMICLASTHSGSYPLTIMFSSIHTLGTMCDSNLGVWKSETLSNILLCYSKACCWFWILICISLVSLTWRTHDHLTRELRSFVIFFGSMRYHFFQFDSHKHTST